MSFWIWLSTTNGSPPHWLCYYSVITYQAQIRGYQNRRGSEAQRKMSSQKKTGIWPDATVGFTRYKTRSKKALLSYNTEILEGFTKYKYKSLKVVLISNARISTDKYKHFQTIFGVQKKLYSCEGEHL